MVCIASGLVMFSASGTDLGREWLPSASGARDAGIDLPGRAYWSGQCLALLC